MSEQIRMSDYVTSGEGTKLSFIDGEKFTVIAVEQHDYTNNGETKPGVMITTKEEFVIEGNKFSKFYTTRNVVVSKLNNEKLRADLESGKSLGPIVCKKPIGKKYFDLMDA